MEKENVIFNWSGGKDSALALFYLKQINTYTIHSLLTTVNRDYGRISMHGIREDILQKQQEKIGLPLSKIYLSANSSNEEYNSQMTEILGRFKEEGVRKAVFGDIFLEDIRKYREEQLAGAGWHAEFPLWNKSTQYLAEYFIDSGFKAIITCVDTQTMPADFAGMYYDKEFLNHLPESVDPCGENGEFHTLVFDGPIFSSPIAIVKGDKVLRDQRFQYCDVVLS